MIQSSRPIQGYHSFLISDPHELTWYAHSLSKKVEDCGGSYLSISFAQMYLLSTCLRSPGVVS